jgi:hypothetical protein
LRSFRAIQPRRCEVKFDVSATLHQVLILKIMDTGSSDFAQYRRDRPSEETNLHLVAMKSPDFINRNEIIFFLSKIQIFPVQRTIIPLYT